MGKRITIEDVARAARVSVATVSRVGTGSARVSPEIVKRVRLAARKLGSDLGGRNKSKVIAFLLGNRDMLHLFHSHMLVGAESYCAARGWNMLFLTLRYPATAPWQELHLPPILARRNMVDGVILGGTNTPNLFGSLRRKAIPFAVLGNNVISGWRPEEHDVVWFDDTQGSFEMTRYLLSLGHRHIWFVGHTGLPWFSRRHEGYCRAMREVGLPPRLSQIDSDNDQDVGYVATKALLSRGESIDAIQAGGDRVAEGAYKALRDSGLRIPDDVSVTGCDDIEAVLLHPSLTTVRIFTEQVGKQMAELVLRRLECPTLPPQQCSIPTQLIKRESCQPRTGVREATTARDAHESASSLTPDGRTEK
ncbi:MAG: LacI family DNA-binding transcriptional regulator [Terriglobia bacterium]